MLYFPLAFFFSFSWPGSGPRFSASQGGAEFEAMVKRGVFEIYTWAALFTSLFIFERERVRGNMGDGK